MIPVLNPPIESTDSCHLAFPEPLSPADRLTIELLTEMYIGIEAPLMTFSRDGYTRLVVPRTIQRKSWNDDEQLTDKAQSLLRVPATESN